MEVSSPALSGNLATPTRLVALHAAPNPKRRFAHMLSFSHLSRFPVLPFALSLFLFLFFLFSLLCNLHVNFSLCLLDSSLHLSESLGLSVCLSLTVFDADDDCGVIEGAKISAGRQEDRK